MSARFRLRVDPIACDGRGLCAELLPELIVLDDWGYPIVRQEDIETPLLGRARLAVRICPKVALILQEQSAEM